MPSRQQLESEFARRWGRMAAKHRQELERLLGDPPDPARVPPAFWERIQREADEEAAALLLLIMLAMMPTRFRQEAGPAAEQFAQIRARDLGRRWAENTRKRLTTIRTITREEVRQRTIEVFSAGRVETIATTETTQAQTAADREGARQDPSITAEYVEMWVLGQCRHCDFCPLVAGTDRAFWSQFSTGPPAHPNCVLPGTIVTTPDVVVGATKSLYRGLVIEISLADGGCLSVTANHPIYSRGRWLSAKLLRQGDDVLRCLDSDRIASRFHPHDNHGPRPIEDVVRSLEMSLIMTTDRMPAAAEDFHGDGRFMDGEIEVISPDSLLMHNLLAKLRHHRGESSFVGSYALPYQFARYGTLPFFRPSMLAPSGGVMSGGSHRDPGLGIDEGESSGIGLLDIAERDLATQDAVDDGSRDTALIRQFIDRYPELVVADKIVDIRECDFSGHVYNLHCEPSNFYFANNIITHNCCCSILFRPPDTRIKPYPAHALVAGAAREVGVF